MTARKWRVGSSLVYYQLELPFLPSDLNLCECGHRDANPRIVPASGGTVKFRLCRKCASHERWWRKWKD